MEQHSEHVEMLIAAGWIDAGAIDDDYQDYVRRALPLDTMTYEEWLDTMREWDEINQQWEREIEPYYSPYKTIEVPRAVQKLEKKLLEQMSWIEAMLYV